MNAYTFEDAPDCENCGAPNAGATVDDADLCGSCAQTQLEDDQEPRGPPLALEEVRHVVPDHDPMHLVEASKTETFCGDPAGGLRHFGTPTETPAEAARLGAWINSREDMCEDCRDAFNALLFGGDAE